MHADLTSPMPSACSATTAHERPTVSRRGGAGPAQCLARVACCARSWCVHSHTCGASSRARTRAAVPCSTHACVSLWQPRPNINGTASRHARCRSCPPRRARHTIPAAATTDGTPATAALDRAWPTRTSPRSGATPAAPPPQGSAGTSGQRTQAVVDLVEAAMTADHPSRHTSAGQCRLVGRLGTGTSYCYHCHQQAACAPPRPALLRF